LGGVSNRRAGGGGDDLKACPIFKN